VIVMDVAAMREMVVLPTYNNGGTLEDILARVERLGLDVCVVDDGSVDGSAEILARWAGGTNAKLHHVITHRQNQGKAAALASAFEWGSDNGFTHAVTLDTDGQLAPEDVPALLEAARKNPAALILGLS
jgi:glycosyltransferase involved in cell wall biosynthesis